MRKKNINTLYKLEDALFFTFHKVLKASSIKENSFHLINKENYEKMEKDFYEYFYESYKLNFNFYGEADLGSGLKVHAQCIDGKLSIWFDWFLLYYQRQNLKQVEMSLKELISYIKRKRKNPIKVFKFGKNSILKETDLNGALEIIAMAGDTHMGYGSYASTISRQCDVLKDKFGNIIIELTTMVWD